MHMIIRMQVRMVSIRNRLFFFMVSGSAQEFDKLNVVRVRSL